MLFFVRATSWIHISSDCILHLLEQLSTGMYCLTDWHWFTPYNFPNKMQSNATWFVFYQFGERIFHYDCGDFWRFLRTWGKNTFGWDAAKDFVLPPGRPNETWERGSRSAFIVVAHVLSWPPFRLRHVWLDVGRSRSLISSPFLAINVN